MTHPRRRRVILVTLVLAAAGTACGLGWSAAATTADPVTAFRSEAVSRGSIRTTISATGTLSPCVTVAVGSQVSGV